MVASFSGNHRTIKVLEIMAFIDQQQIDAQFLPPDGMF
jgi:hypothetical protein